MLVFSQLVSLEHQQEMLSGWQLRRVESGKQELRKRSSAPAFQIQSFFRQPLQLDDLAGGKSRRPRPLKIIAAQPAGHINDFADKMQARDLACFHRF